MQSYFFLFSLVKVSFFNRFELHFQIFIKYFLCLFFSWRLSSSNMHSCWCYAITGMMAVWSQQLEKELEGKTAISLQIVPLSHMWHWVCESFMSHRAMMVCKRSNSDQFNWSGKLRAVLCFLCWCAAGNWSGSTTNHLDLSLFKYSGKDLKCTQSDLLGWARQICTATGHKTMLMEVLWLPLWMLN